ncbi:arabinofuranosidase catalytic domain-containing protein [Maribellus mangrovi]|uniref:arabinofuranosidase catalytic domain-containing protein n=1 Tax=Maribellus mangrovi TaxID=3133146 RepID=UPI0030EB1B61
MKRKNLISIVMILSLLFPALLMAQSGDEAALIPPRPEGPCDIYTENDCPCVAAHSTTRALYASYNGPLYQIMRQSDGKTLDIGVVQASEGDPGGYADAAAQDEFCKDTYAWITILYDQSGNGNHLIQAPRGGTGRPTAMGGFNSLPMADMAPVTVMGHKVYGIFIEPGMGLRQNDPKGTAVDDQAEGQYWVINGHHYNNGCCYDYGNAEIDSRDDGDGTMETTYYGNATAWYHGQPPGPWIMTDQENNLVGGVNESPNDKYLPDLPSISWRFVTATADGEPHHWRSMGGDAQGGDLEVMFDGPRIINDRSSYDPMRKQGAILLGNGGDNSNASQGTFYEAAMTAPGTFPTDETNQKIQDNIVAAGYDVSPVSIAPASATDTPPGLQTFSPGSTQNTTVTFTNTTGASVAQVQLSIAVPKGWKSVVLNSGESIQEFTEPIAPGEQVSTTFSVTSGTNSFNGDIVGIASWTSTENGKIQTETMVEKVRNVSPIKINEFRISDGSNTTNSFIELYNNSDNTVDISDWSLTQHATQLPVFSSIKVPAKTTLGPRSFYLLGLSNSGLAVPALKGESILYVRNAKGMNAGDEITIGSGTSAETHKIAEVTVPTEPEDNSPFARFRRGTPGLTTIWQPLPEGPVITFPAGSNSISVASVDGFEVGQKMAIGYGATYPVATQSIEKYEVVTITEVGKPGTQAWLSMDAKAGDTNIKVSSVENISVGDKIRLDIESEGHGIEWVTVKSVGTKSSRSTFMGPLTDEDDPGTGLDLEEPLKFDHSSNLPFSVWGTGISFEPACQFDHSSNEPVLALGNVITLDKSLSKNHEIDEVVYDANVKTEGYQDAQAPDQWFGGPALSSNAGNIVLRDADDNVVDGLNYGAIVDPWLAEGYQGRSGTNEFGCFAATPAARSRFWWRMDPNSSPNISTGRFPDGTDHDSNSSDFVMQKTMSLATASEAGSNNIKISSADDFNIGQKVVVGSGANSETAVIALIGSTGGTTVSKAIEKGVDVIPVEDVSGFSEGQTINIKDGENEEIAVIASITVARRRFGRRNNDDPGNSITVTKPLAKSYNEGTIVAGSGITFAEPLAKAHENGTTVASNVPTPGQPNQF